MTILEELGIDKRMAQTFDLAYLKSEIERREKEIESLDWAKAEHKKEIDNYNKLILWKLEDGNK